jgi:predicted lipid-binding transport protein (Tim44 family)
MIGSGRSFFSLQNEERIRQDSAEFQQRLAAERGTSSNTPQREEVVAFLKNSEQQPANPVTGPASPDEPAGLSAEARERHREQYTAGLLAKSPASLTAEEKQFLRAAIGAYRG